MKKKLYQAIAQSFQAYLNCEKSGNAEWLQRHEERIEELVKEHMPSGSGFDAGTRFVFLSSRPEKLVFQSEYHHMNENGYYDGWSKFDIIVTPSLVSGFDLRLRSGGVWPRRYADTKDYIVEVFQEILGTEIEEETGAVITPNLLRALINEFPGILDGETDVNGGDLVAWLSEHKDQIEDLIEG